MLLVLVRGVCTALSLVLLGRERNKTPTHHTKQVKRSIARAILRLGEVEEKEPDTPIHDETMNDIRSSTKPSQEEGTDYVPLHRVVALDMVLYVCCTRYKP